MSIFSRLFQKTADGEGEQPDEGEGSGLERPATESRGAQTSARPSAAAPEGRGTGTMRPTAPDLQLPIPGSPHGVTSTSRRAATKNGAAVASTNTANGDPGTGTASSTSLPAAKVAKRDVQPPPPRAPQKADAQGPSVQRAPLPTVPEPGRASSRTPGSKQDASQPSASKLAVAKKTAPQPSPSSSEAGGPALSLQLSDGDMDLGAKPPPSANVPTAAAPNTRGGPVQKPVPAPLPAPPVKRTAREVAPQFPAVEPDTFSKFLNELDEGFGAIMESGHGAVASAAPSTSARVVVAHPAGEGEKRPLLHDSTALAEVRELFAELAKNHMRQVRDFMIGVRWGEARGDFLEGCEPAVLSLKRAAKEMELAALDEALDAFAAALRDIVKVSAGLDPAARKALLEKYAKLAELMPQAFALDGEQNKREAAIIHALLEQVPDVRKTTIDKMYAAGLSSLDVIFLAKPDEIAQTTGIATQVAARIVETFQSYRRDMLGIAQEGARTGGDRERLEAALSELSSLHEEFERVASSWSEDDAAKKRHLRQARTDAFLKIKIFLARMGEIERLAQIERLPYESKIAKLSDYVKEAGRPHAASL